MAYKDPEKKKLYEVWRGMIRRCCNPGHPSYHNYGGRGIQVCDRWLHSFKNFLEDMTPRPSGRMTIDRVNNNGNYDPNNCRWVTHRQNCSNKRNNVYIRFNGEIMTVTRAATIVGICADVVIRRLNRGSISLEEAFTRPVQKRTRRTTHWQCPCPTCATQRAAPEPQHQSHPHPQKCYQSPAPAQPVPAPLTEPE